MHADDGNAWRAALTLAEGDEHRARQWWRGIRDAAITIVVDKWPAIERVAHALQERGKLDADAVQSAAGVIDPTITL